LLEWKTMTRTVLLLLAVFVLELAPRPAAAQLTSGNIALSMYQVTEGGVVTRTTATELGKALNAAQCADAANVDVGFTTTNAPSGILFVDLWVGTPSEDCSTAVSRVPGDMRICTHLTPDPTLDATDGSFTVSLADLIAGSTACTTGGSEVSLNLWALATGETETTGTITADQFGYIQFSVDPTAPAAPVPNQTTASGDTGISITWPAAAETDVTYRAYVDSASGSCETGTLTAGAAAPVGDPTIPSQSTGSDASGITLSAADFGLEDGQSALVAITSVDANDNESVLSQTVCVTRVPSAGFCDVYAADSGEPCPQGCAVSQPGAGGSPLPLLPLLALVLGLARRRSRR